MEETLELDIVDKLRITNNINELKEENIPYLEYMVRIPINSLTEIREEEEIINKLLVDYVIASSAKFMLNSSIFSVGKLLDDINKKYNIDNIFTLENKALIVNILNKLYSQSELEEFCLKFESVNVCLWALGLVKKIDSKNKCNIEEIDKIILKYKNYDSLVKATKMRSKEEILTKFDLITRYYWAFRKVNEEELASKLSEDIVDIQCETFEFITSFSYDSLSNKNIKIDYDKNDVKFSFEIPSYLSFDTVSNKKGILALSSNDNTSKIVITDLGAIKISDFNDKVNKYIKLLIKNGFTFIEKYDMQSSFLKEKIVRIIVKKSNYALNIYFVYISNHLIRFDSLIESYIDSSNYYENINSKNTNLDFNILFSLREVE